MPSVTRPVSNAALDPLLETQVFWVKYRRSILIALLVVLLGSAAYGGYRFYTMRRDATAAALLAEAKGAPDYQKVIDQYPAAPAAASAYLLLARDLGEKKQFVEANEALKTFIARHPKHELVMTAKMAMAANLESLGRADEALEMYRRLAAEYPRSYNAPFALLAQAHLFKHKGQIEEARRVCETVLTQYRQSQAAGEATRYLRSLKLPATAAAVPEDAASPAASPAP